MPVLSSKPSIGLWHTIYSIEDVEECSRAIQANFQVTTEAARRLAALDFKKAGFGNKSARAIRKILPYLMEGYGYSDACSLAGYNHSNSLTKDENLKRSLLDALPSIPKNSLRQPVVEKILNQMVNLVNAIVAKHGKPDEIRIELARELKQSKEERNEAYTYNSQRERENKAIADRLEGEYGHMGVRATRNNILKYRLFSEINGEESKVNATCIYCGQQFGITDALLGRSVDIEHIIPKSKLFDDSQSNKTLTHRKCNADKGDKTAFDFIQSKGSAALDKYIETVESLYKNRIIGKAKRDKLLMSEDKIPKNFIDRQLRETQYIARKAKEILEQVCHHVWSTSGTVTAHLRNIWGWNDVLPNLQLPKYKELGLTEWREWETNDGQQHKREEIKDWSKRDDHRHHAIDALVVACTKQGFIQRLNTLSAAHTKEEMYKEVVNGKYKEKLTLLDRYLIEKRPFHTAQVMEAASEILVSFKPGKRVATRSTYKAQGKNMDTGVIVPRGALSEDSVYGKIQSVEKTKPVKYLFEHPHLIFKPYIKALVEKRLEEHHGDIKKAVASLKKEPIYLDEKKAIPLEHATCYKEEVVIRKPVASLNEKQVDDIIDRYVKQKVKERLAQYGGKAKEAFKNLENDPIWYNEANGIPIKSVRCFTGLSAIEPVKKDENGRHIGFVKPGNNHHIAFYLDAAGTIQEHVCTFWHAVERRKYALPVIIKEPQQIWDSMLEKQVEYPQNFLDKLPGAGWKYIESLQQNEMFILGLPSEQAERAIQDNDKKLISAHLYRVQKIATKYYVFRHHLETEINDSKEALAAKRYASVRSNDALLNLYPRKIAITNIGEIKEGYEGGFAVLYNPKLEETMKKAMKDIKDQSRDNVHKKIVN